MRYEDASNSFQASGPQANDDSDQLPAGAKEAATGNLITGEGTQYGAAGADSAAGGHITSIAGKGGEDSSFAGGKLSVTGEYGKLTVDAEGNYSYKPNNNAPENVRDRFTYTLADNQGGTDTAALVIELGKTQVVIKADAQQIVPGPDGVVTLPPGVELSDVMVVGRNLVINMPDGTQLIIVDGAVFVPQLVVDGVSVPATNVAALLIGQEPQPAAGELPPSSGGNFALPPPPLDPGVPLGDLIPPTETNYIPPEPQELFPEEDREPTIVIQPVDQAPSVNAIDSVDERGLPTRNGGEPEGTGEGADGNASNNSDPSEATSGTIIIDSPDGIGSVTIAGADGIPHDIVVGLVVQGQYGTLTITGIVGDDYTYSYVLNDNTSGDNTHDNFAVVLTDSDGDVASASLTINIIDDVPTARDDVDSVAEGGPTVADGNVLTGTGGADANNTDGVKDTVGADDADVTGFNQGGTNGTLGVPFAAHYGTLVLNADGSYTYTLDSEDPAVRALGNGDTLTEVFTYTLTDGDGDVDTATLTITIIGSNDAPTIGTSAAVVSEEGLPGGIADNVGSDDTTNSATASGTVPVADADGDALTVTLTTTGLAGLGLESNGVPIVWALSNGGHTLTGSAGGNPIITVTIQDDGDYTVQLTGPVDHPNDAIEDDLSFDISVSVSDGSETTTGGKITLTIEDDSPTVTAGEVEPQLLVDESNFTVNETQSFGDVFTIHLGGDGGTSSSTSYALGINPGSTGLVDTLTNEAVVLSLVNGEVIGRAGAGGPIVFVISVNADGDVTVDQQRAVVHADPTNPDDAISLADDNLITLTATAEDNDGDTASATIGLGKNIVLEDDGPSISRNQQAAPDLVTDDSNTPNDTDSASFAGLFTGAFGADGPKDADNNDVADADAIVYNLSINGGNGTDSGLNDVLTGDNILLRVVGNTIEGYLQNDTGVVAFTLTLDPNTGVVTQEQDRAITHDDPTDPVESGGDAETMASNLIAITATITDGDGDQASASANIGDSFHFEDDGPSVSPSGEEPTLTVDESALGTDDSADFSGAFNVLFGADGPAASNDTTFALGISGVGVASGLVDTLSGDPILLFMNGDVVEGRVGGVGGAVAFTVSVNGSGVVELDQLRSVVHNDPTDPDESSSPAQLASDGLITLTATATDGDGDTDSATIGIGKNLNFEDDGPTIDRNQNSAPVLTTDDTNTPGDTDGPVSFAGLFTGAFGADGPKDADDNNVADADAIAYSLSLKAGNATDSGLFDVVSGDKILLRVNGSGDVEGYLQNSPATIAFTIDLQAGGNIRLVQDRAITHNDPADPVESGSSAATMAGDLVVLNATITDGDGDTATAAANIGDSFRFEDDGPQAVDDTDSVGAPGTSATGNVITGVDIVGGDANGTDGNADDVGADTPGSVVGVAAGDTNAILSNPATVGVQIQGDFGKLTLNANGSYTYTRDAGSPGGGQDVFTYTLTDADGDKVTATLTIQIGDAIPVAGTASAAVDDDGLGGANAAGANDINANTFPNPDDLDGPASSEATFRGMLTVTGGDGDIDFALVAPVGAVTVGQETVNITGTGALLTATIATSPDSDRVGDTLFTVSLNQETGEYIVTLVDNVLHGDDANNDEDGSEVSVNIPFQVVDADGDNSAANGTLNIVFNDDVPSAAVVSTVQTVSVDETAGIQGDSNDTTSAGVIALFAGVSNKGTDGDMPAPQYGQSVAGLVAATGSTYGADGAGTTVFSLNVSSAGVDSGLDTTAGASIFLFKEGDLVVGRVGNGSGPAAFAVAIDPSTGVVSMVEYMSIHHPTGGAASPDESVSIADGAILAVVTVTDGDGDTATNSVGIGDQIQFQDDAPTAAVVSTVQTVSVDETAGIQGDSNDTTAPAVLALFAGVGNVGTDSDMPAPQYGQSVSGLVAPTGSSYGADGAGTTAYSLNVSSAGVDSGLDTTAGASIFLFKEGDLVVGRVGNGSGPAAFAVAIDPSTGVVSMVEYMSIKHPTGGAASPDESVSIADGAILAVVTVTDGDGDTATNSVGIGDQIQFQDDAPTAAVVSTVQTVSVDETAGVQGDSNDTTNAGVIALFAGVSNIGTDPNMLAQYGQSVSGLVAPTGSSYGADGAGTTAYSLNVSSAGVNSGLDTTAGQDILLFKEGALIVGRVSGGPDNGKAAFAVAIDPSTGVVSMVEYLSIKHPTNPNNDESVSIADGAILAVVTVTDGDGDTATNSVGIGDQIQFQDDGPVAIQPDAAVLNNEALATVTADLDDDGEVLTDFGADGPGLVQFANITNGADSGFTSGGDTITYWLSNNDQTLQGRTNSTNGSDGQLVMTVQINQAAGDYTVTLSDTIDNGAGISFDNLTSSKAGNVDVRAVGADDPNTTVDLLLTASLNGANATINTDSDSIGAGNQSMDQGETVRIDFVENAQANVGKPSGFSYDGHVSSQTYEQTIPQVQGSQNQTVAFRVYALDTTVTDAGTPDDTPVAGLTPFSDSTTVGITHVTIDGYAAGETPVTVAIGAVGDWTTIAYGVSAQLQADGSVIFAGVQEGDRYGIETGTGFNAIAVTSLATGVGPVGGQSTTNSFDLGVLAIGQVQTGDPIDLTFDLKITDGDGDTLALPGAIDVTINPAGTTTLLSTFAASSSQEEQVQKSAANANTLTLATAVAAAGYVEPVAAHDNGNHNGHGQNSELASVATVETVERYSVSGDSGSASVSMLAPEASSEASDPVKSSNGSSQANSNSNHGVDDSSAHAAPESKAAPAADDGGSHASSEAAAGPVAPSVMMVSAEALQAIAGDGNAQKGGSVEKIVAEALHHGGSDVDAVLANLPGGNGGLQAIAHMASPDVAAVSGWHMAGHGAFGTGFDMMFKMDVATHHQDAVQPVQNG